jgi:hypothetical protein
VAIVVPVLLGLYALRHAWLILIGGETVLSPIDRIALWLLHYTKGSAAARERELQLTRLRTQRAAAISSLVVGVVLVLYAALNLAAVVLGWTRLVVVSP